MIVGITISNFQVYFIRFSLWKHSLQFVSNEGIYSVGKDLVKQNFTFCQTESFASPSQVGLTQETFGKTSSLAWLFIFHSCALQVALSWVKFSWDTCENHLSILWSLSLDTLLHSFLTIRNPHIYREKWLKKLQSNLTRN